MDNKKGFEYLGREIGYIVINASVNKNRQTCAPEKTSDVVVKTPRIVNLEKIDCYAVCN